MKTIMPKPKEQQKYLRDEMEKIFGANGYPEEFVNSLEEI